MKKEESLKMQEVFSEELFTEALTSSEEMIVIRGGIKSPTEKGDWCGVGCSGSGGDNCGVGC